MPVRGIPNQIPNAGEYGGHGIRRHQHSRRIVVATVGAIAKASRKGSTSKQFGMFFGLLQSSPDWPLYPLLVPKMT